ncbi:MAG: ribosome biogenesis GTPase YlqF [Clostridia bacterium]|nr:ribosome biogenesis GTPase YlqF [Clostridia bacterium]
MPSEQIQWFPGHMAKTRRIITENIKNVDLVIEVLDARIPYSSRNPELRRLTAGKPMLVLLNKAGLADPSMTKLWAAHLTKKDTFCLPVDCMTGEGIRAIVPTVREILKEKIERHESRGMTGKRLRAMILGIPNVGKSTLINRLVGNNRAKTENRPGVTVDKAWFTGKDGLDLMDMPGLLWPKFDDTTVGENLAITGAIKDKILDTETIALRLCGRLRRDYPALLLSRFPFCDDAAMLADMSDLDVMEAVGKKRGFLISGGEINYERTANVLLEEFRSAKIGRITLDRIPTEASNKHPDENGDKIHG